MTKDAKIMYGMVAGALLLVGGFIILSSKQLRPGRTEIVQERQVEPGFEVVDSEGTKRNFSDLRGKVSLVSHVFTRCPGQCAGIGVALKDVRDEFQDAGLLQLVSVSLDPAHDTPAVLKTFSENHGLAGDDWWFVTGETDPLNQYMADVFLLKAEAKPPEERDNEFDLFKHEPMVVLVDHELTLRGWYFPFKPESAKAMKAELKAALAAAKNAS